MPSERINWNEDPPLDARQQREVFARFGLASYQAQCVERQVGILLATIYNPDFIRSDPDERDEFFNREFVKTLGRLVRALQQRVTLSDELESRLRRGVELRNWLTHHYFWERAGSILAWEGRERMIAELQEASDFLSSLDAELTTITDQWLTYVGVSEETIQAELSKYVSERYPGTDE